MQLPSPDNAGRLTISCGSALKRFTSPVAHVNKKTSHESPASCSSKFDARLMNATNWPSSEIRGDMESPLDCTTSFASFAGSRAITDCGTILVDRPDFGSKRKMSEDEFESAATRFVASLENAMRDAS